MRSPPSSRASPTPCSCSPPATPRWAPTACSPSARARGELDTSQLRVAQLDEYAGLAARRPPLALRLDGALVPRAARHSRQRARSGSTAALPPAQSRAATTTPPSRRRGGFELAILGLGPNGHLGFNEPPVARDAPTRLVPLTPESIVSNARYWGDEDDVPAEALTCGMASHAGRAPDPARRLRPAQARDPAPRRWPRPDEDVPASWLQTAPGDVVGARRPGRGGRYSLIAPASTPRMKWRCRKR